MTDALTHPAGGERIDTGGRPVSRDPIEGGVAVVNCSVPVGHDAHVVYREQTPEEKKDQRKREKDMVGFRRANTALFLRLTRDQLLRATDQFDLPSGQKIAGGKAKLEAWQKWRQRLRDLPASAAAKNAAEPEDVSWPRPPAVTSSLVDHRRLWPSLDWSKYGG